MLKPGGRIVISLAPGQGGTPVDAVDTSTHTNLLTHLHLLVYDTLTEHYSNEIATIVW
jgi:hypothetical protein